MLLSPRMLYKISKYWRYYVLLLIASILSFILIFIGKNDPKLDYYLPAYFKMGSQYYYDIYKNGNVENIFNLMENSTLDYDYMYTNSRFCFNGNTDGDADKEDLEENAAADDDNDDEKFKILFLSISEVGNVKYRQAARQTYGKNLKKFNLKLLFVIGNRPEQQQQQQQNLQQEINEFNDIVQVDMPDDNQNFTSIKTLIGLRWAITYCSNAQYVYVISDFSVINPTLLNKYLYKDNLFSLKKINSSVLAGYCNYTDEKLAVALRLFYNNNGNSKRAKFLYKGDYCSNLGWIVSLNGAKKLWTTALNKVPYIMRSAPSYLNGYMAYKANLKHLNIFEYEDSVQHSQNQNCLNIFQSNENKLLCAENFSIQNRYNNYISTWNTANDQYHFAMSKL